MFITIAMTGLIKIRCRKSYVQNLRDAQYNVMSFTEFSWLNALFLLLGGHCSFLHTKGNILVWLLNRIYPKLLCYLGVFASIVFVIDLYQQAVECRWNINCFNNFMKRHYKIENIYRRTQTENSDV